MALYAPEPPGKDFFYWMAAHPDTTAILVVDECPPAEAARLRALADMKVGCLIRDMQCYDWLEA